MVEGRWQSLRRDLRFLFGGLVDGPPPPFVVRRRAARPLEGREVVVERVERPAEGSVTLHLEDPGGAPFAFEAGQFFTLLVDVGGRVERRAYSACTAPTGGSTVAVTVRRVDGGRVSPELVDAVEPGRRLRLLGPSGAFVPPADATELVLVAGGSGITPMRSIVADRLARPGDATRLTVVYGHRRLEEAAFATELASLAAAHPSRLSVHLVLERTPTGDAPPHTLGRLDRATLVALLGERASEAPPTGGRRVHMLCGPTGMLDEARAALEALGVPPRDVLVERFVSTGATSDASTLPTTAQPLVVRREGGARALSVAPGQTILEAATASGVALPYSCTMGGCGACKLRLVEGEVAHAEPSCLSPAERASGEILACVSRPLGPCAVELP